MQNYVKINCLEHLPYEYVKWLGLMIGYYDYLKISVKGFGICSNRLKLYLKAFWFHKYDQLNIIFYHFVKEIKVGVLNFLYIF